MNRINKIINYKDQQPDELFIFAKSALVTLGYEIYKKREIGYLFEANKRIDEQLVNVNLNVNPISTKLTITITSDSAGLDLIENLLEELLLKIDDLVGVPSSNK